jgi:hypothetical protein
VIIAVLLFSFGAGWLTLRAIGGARDRAGETAALTLAAGLGTTALLLGGLGLVERLAWAPELLLAGATATAVAAGTRWRTWRTWRPRWSKPPAVAWIVVAMVVAGGIGAFAPVTEFDSLAYPIPIARHLADDGAWRFWADQARSVFPLSQQLLIVPQVQRGDLNLGLLGAVQLALAAALIVSLARRVTTDRDVPWVAAIIALGSPAVAFLAASAKEDLLLLTMTTAAAVSLVSPPGAGAALRVGLFAGFAAGAKFTGVPVAAAVVLCVPFCCGRERRLAHLGLAIAAAIAAGGLWYAVNLARFGTPVPVASFGPWFAAPILSPAVLADWANGFGLGRGALDALIAPVHMAVGADTFGGRGNWINPIAFLGVAALAMRGTRRAMWPLVAIAAAGYVAWFLQIQVARLLVPALALAAVPAASLVVGLSRRSRAMRIPIGLVLALSAGVVVAVGAVRMARYVAHPAGFLARETPHYADIAWMNANLHPSRDRVASFFEASGYLRVPWVAMNATYQTVVGHQDIEDPARLHAALVREGFTYVFGPADRLAMLAGEFELVRANGASVVGGSRFFRTPETMATAIYRVR